MVFRFFQVISLGCCTVAARLTALLSRISAGYENCGYTSWPKGIVRTTSSKTTRVTFPDNAYDFWLTTTFHRSSDFCLQWQVVHPQVTVEVSSAGVASCNVSRAMKAATRIT